jgi:hypothetical protein
MSSNKQKAYLIVSLTFLLGVAVGVSGHHLLSSQQSAPRISKTVGEFTNELTTTLTLDPVQKIKVEEILNDAQRQYQELREQNRPQFLAIREATRKRVRELLSAEQQPLYEQWLRELDAKREKKAAEENNKK